jgi:sugar lactone lactonase YvrE
MHNMILSALTPPPRRTGQADGKPIPVGGLYSWEGSGEKLKIKKHLDNVAISNGLVWDRAGTTFYYIDTPTMQVDAFDFDGATG